MTGRNNTYMRLKFYAQNDREVRECVELMEQRERCLVGWRMEFSGEPIDPDTKPSHVVRLSFRGKKDRDRFRQSPDIQSIYKRYAFGPSKRSSADGLFKERAHA